MNRLRLNDTWYSIPIDYIQFGHKYGLISHFENQDIYKFPMSYVLSLFSEACLKKAKEYLQNRKYDDDITPQFEQLIIGRLKDTLKILTTRQKHVLIRREEILGFNYMTLEEIGQQLEVTRERIRQIEDKTWKRIWS